MGRSDALWLDTQTNQEYNICGTYNAERRVGAVQNEHNAFAMLGSAPGIYENSYGRVGLMVHASKYEVAKRPTDL